MLKILKTASYFSLSQIVSGAVNLVVTLLYAKNIPTADYGKISVLSLCFLIGSILVDSKLATAFSVKREKRLIDNQKGMLLTILVYYLAITSILFLFGLSGIVDRFVMFKIDFGDWFFICLYIFLFNLSNLFSNVLVLEQRGAFYFLVKIIWNLAFGVSAYILVSIRPRDIMGFFYANIFGYFVSGCVLIFGVYRKMGPGHSLSSWLELKELVRLSGPLTIGAILSIALAWSDRYAISALLGLSATGIYAFAYRLSDVLNSVFMMPIGQAISPRMVKQFCASKYNYSEYLDMLLKLYLGAGWIVIVVYQLVLEICFVNWFPDKYSDSKNLVTVFLVGSLVYSVSNLIGLVFIADERPRVPNVISFLTLLVSAFVSCVLIKIFGLLGGAVSIVVAYLINLTAIILSVRIQYRLCLKLRKVFTIGVVGAVIGCHNLFLLHKYSSLIYGFGVSVLSIGLYGFWISRILIESKILGWPISTAKVLGGKQGSELC